VTTLMHINHCKSKILVAVIVICCLQSLGCAGSLNQNSVSEKQLTETDYSDINPSELEIQRLSLKVEQQKIEIAHLKTLGRQAVGESEIHQKFERLRQERDSLYRMNQEANLEIRELKKALEDQN